MIYPNEFSLTSSSLSVFTGCFVLEGTLHQKMSLGCQDACHLIDSNYLKIAIICDGCSLTGNYNTSLRLSHNQVGAILGAQYIGSYLEKLILKSNYIDDDIIYNVLINTMEQTYHLFYRLCSIMGLEPGSKAWDEFVLSKLIFTIVGIIVIPNQFWIFGIGDGVYGIDGKIYFLTSSPTPYLNQRLHRGGKEQIHRIKIYEKGDINDINFLWIATDGLHSVLSCEEGRENFFSFLKDEFTCLRNKKGEDMTIQAFRRKVYKPNARRFSDDVAMAVIRMEPRIS